MVRMLNSPRAVVPTYLDELATLFGNMPDPEFNARRQPVDTNYSLITALIETGEWLDEPFNSKETPGDRKSMLSDLRLALNLRGPKVTARSESADRFLEAMQNAFDHRDDPVIRAKAVELHGKFKDELADPESAAAAFDDLLDVLRNPSAFPDAVDGRVSVLLDVLTLAGRPARDICKLIGAVVDDQAIEIGEVRRQLDGVTPKGYDRPDIQLGLPEDNLLELARRYLREPQPARHHVVWVAYANARIMGDQDWREVVGRVEFFDGPTLVEAVKDAKLAPLSRPLPGELIELQAAGRLDFWPQAGMPASWVAARVDLDVTNIASPIQTGRAEANAIVALATFQGATSTWKPLAGVVHLVDGRPARWEDFHLEDLDATFAERDSTAEELPEIASQIGPHLPVTNPVLRRVLRELSTLNISTGSLEIDLLTHDIRVIEMVARRCQQEWPDFPIAEATSYARRTIPYALADHVERAIYAYRFDTGQDLAPSIREYLPNGKVRIDRAAALARVPQLAARLPLHTSHGRRLRELADRTSNVQMIDEWVRELEDDYRRKIARATRFRNGITHGAAASLEVARTVRSLINIRARLSLSAALDAIAEGRDIGKAIADRRRRNRAWKTNIRTGTDTVPDAIFGTNLPN